MEALNEIKTWLTQPVKPLANRISVPQNGRQVLFKGANQYTKLAAAQKLAQEAGKELIRVDLSQVVSKYIGETEKNLNAVFEKAAKSGAVLFFDEADALFGKRTNVKDAHDKYANQEVNYLLQKIESHPGLAILSLNAKTNIDSPFIRRLRYVVEIE
ncbi:MAG: ATP-binding protein [Sphingobacteriales bacterium]|nr:MAG: ATP-binding protein [Sphingobacteriales bacterium]